MVCCDEEKNSVLDAKACCIQNQRIWHYSCTRGNIYFGSSSVSNIVVVLAQHVYILKNGKQKLKAYFTKRQIHVCQTNDAIHVQ